MFFPPKTKKDLRFCTTFFLSAIIILAIAFIVVVNYKSHTNLILGFSLLLFFITIISVVLIMVVIRNTIEKKIKASIKKKPKKLKQKPLDKSTVSGIKNSSYLSNISHEIRIPLSTILGMVKMLKETDLDTNQQAQLEILEYSSQHLLQLVNLILDNANNKTKKLVVNNDAFNIEKDLIKLFKVFEYQAWEKGLDFEFKFMNSKKHNFLLIGDFGKIQQILINLVNNAIKFTLKGKIEIIIDNTFTHDDSQIVTFYVKDTGRGMSKKEMQHMLNTNNYSKSSTNTTEGLGLSVTKKLVKFLGGYLKVESKKNEGSIFYFSLQLKKTLNLKVETPIEQPTLLNNYHYRFNILVAEDNKMNQKVIKFLLEINGAECTFVTNGEDAVNLFNVIDFDMIFMDIYMPKMDGYEATKIIKSTDKYNEKKVPIIAISASAFQEDIDNAKRAGVDYFLAKPIDNLKLKKLLDKYSLKQKNIL